MSLSSSTVGGKIKYKIVLLRDQHVGKTSIIWRFINDRFENNYDVRYFPFRPPLESISLSEISHIRINIIDCNSGILLDKKGSEVWYPAISKIVISVFLSMTLPTPKVYRTWLFGSSFTASTSSTLLFQLQLVTKVTNRGRVHSMKSMQ